MTKREELIIYSQKLSRKAAKPQSLNINTIVKLLITYPWRSLRLCGFARDSFQLIQFLKYISNKIPEKLKI